MGNTAKGALRLAKRGSFLQRLTRPSMDRGKYRVTARVKTEKLEGHAAVKILWLEEGGSKQELGESKQIAEDVDWKQISCDFELSAKPVSVLIMPSLFGTGTAWFDDLELRAVKDGKSVGPNLLRNGDIDMNDGGGDPLIQVDELAPGTITPALLLVKDGKVVRKLHRIGAMSPHYVEQWLLGCLKEPRAKRAEKGEKLAAVQKLIRDGSWSEALSLLTALRTKSGLPEGQFWEGLCLHRLGRHTEARDRWQQAVGPTRWGRRAAACLLPRGPHPILSLSERTWTEPGANSSTQHPKSFDGRLALRILLEMQDEGGGFGSHNSVMTMPMYDYWQPAFTGIAVQAILAWKDKDPQRKAKTESAIDRARKFLVDWSKVPPRGRLGAFNHPYAVQALLELDEKDAAQRLTDKILAEQAVDGSWSIYGPQRPTSFNTAQSILSLVAARKAGLTVPQSAIDKACAALEKMRSDKELFPYSPVLGHGWMTTEYGSVARDPLCEHALLVAGRGDAKKLAEALHRFLRFHEELQAPTKHYSADFNGRGHGSYFLLYGLHNAIEAAAHVEEDLRANVIAEVQGALLKAAEKDSTAIDHSMYGRAYGTGMALLINAPRK